MDHEACPDKSCTPQHFTSGCPTNEWTPEQLSTYAQAQHEAILDGERHLTVAYWRLGMALNLLRRNYNYGQWARLLTALSIEKTKASRARTIARSFGRENDLAGLTVKQALDRRAKGERKPAAGQSGLKKSCKLGQFLDHVTRTAELLIDEAGFAASCEAAVMLPVVDAALDKLVRIRGLLRQQAQASPT
jgi:hypothetical protein